MTNRFLAILALPLLLAGCAYDKPAPKPPPKSNNVRVDIDFEKLEIPKHALGEGWQRVSHEHSTTPGFPPRGAFKGVGESKKLEVTFSNRSLSPAGLMTLVVSKFSTPEDAESMLAIILLTKENSKFNEAKVFGYTGYDYAATNSKQAGKMINLGNVLVSVFADDALDLPTQERLLRYLFSKLSVPIPKSE